MRRSWLWLLLAAVLYVGLRWLVLAGAFDATALPFFELYPMGTIAKVVPEHHSLPLSDYYDNAAGQLLTGLLAIPFYEAFGPSYLALKLVPFALGLLALIVVFLLTRDLFGVRAAALAALLFALTPVTSVKYSLIASGNHYENVFFSLCAIAVFFHAHRRGAPPAWLAASGFAAGLALFVFLGALVPIALLAAVHLGLRGWRRALRDLGWVVPGFALGIAPLFALNVLGRDSRGLVFLDTRFGATEAARERGVLQRFGEFFSEHLPDAGVFPDLGPLPGRAADWALLAAFAASWCAVLALAWSGARELARGALRREGAGPEVSLARIAFVPLVLYLPACALAYAFSNLRIGGYSAPIEVAGYRYFLLHFALAAILIGAVFARWTERERRAGWRIAGWALAIVALATGAFAFALPDGSFRCADRGERYAGAWYPYFARGLLGKRNAHPQLEVIELAARVPSAHRARVYFGIGFYAAFEQTNGAGKLPSQFDLARGLAGWPERYQADVARGIGSYLRPKNGDLAGEGARVQRRILDALARGEPGAAGLAEGLHLAWAYPLVSDVHVQLNENLRMVATSAPELVPALARGAGMHAGLLVARGIRCDLELVSAMLERLPGESRKPFYLGLGYGIVEGRELPSWPAEVDQLVAAEWRDEVARGYVQGLKHLYGEQELARIGAQVAASLPEDVARQLGVH